MIFYDLFDDLLMLFDDFCREKARAKPIFLPKKAGAKHVLLPKTAGAKTGLLPKTKKKKFEEMSTHTFRLVLFQVPL